MLINLERERFIHLGILLALSFVGAQCLQRLLGTPIFASYSLAITFVVQGSMLRDRWRDTVARQQCAERARAMQKAKREKDANEEHERRLSKQKGQRKGGKR